MIGHRTLTFDDYLAIFRRRWWALVAPAMLGATIVYLASLLIPNRYTSVTMVLISGQTMPETYVSPVVTADLNQRLAAIQEQILSRSRLQSVIERFGLYADERRRAPMEDLVARLRAAIVVQPVQPMLATTSTRLPGFTVNVTAESAELAQQICSQVTSMFMEENVQGRQKQAQDTTEFLSAQLSDAKTKLDEKDTRLAEFKRRNIGRLPDSEQTNLTLLMGLNTHLEATTEALSRAQQNKLFSESLLLQEVRTAQHPETFEQQLEDLQKQLRTQQTRYTNDHPDVVKTKHDIEKLKEDIAAANALTPRRMQDEGLDAAVEPAQIQTLRAQIQQDTQVIIGRTKQQEQLQAQIKEIQARVQSSPMVEQEFKALTRDYQTALDFYNDLLKKRDQSALSTALERTQQSEQFRVLDPPSLPPKPSFPDRLRFALGGLAGGLALGAGLIMLLEMRDSTMRTQRDAELLLQVPVLALIPAAKTRCLTAKELVSNSTRIRVKPPVTDV